jgi:uncharacterized protein (DUF1810 family)
MRPMRIRRVGRVSAIDLSRFVDGYDRDFERARGEIDAGRKRSHWMWYIFPQIAGLGFSPTSVRYAIADRNEAEAFLTDPRLGPRYCRLVDAVWQQIIGHRISVRALFGSPDDQKLVSSLTLFTSVAAGLAPTPERTTLLARGNEVLDAAADQGLARCATTVAALTR